MVFSGVLAVGWFRAPALGEEVIWWLAERRLKGSVEPRPSLENVREVLLGVYLSFLLGFLVSYVRGVLRILSAVYLFCSTAPITKLPPKNSSLASIGDTPTSSNTSLERWKRSSQSSFRHTSISFLRSYFTRRGAAEPRQIKPKSKDFLGADESVLMASAQV